ncbi:MAG: DUF2800 domain-containing protein [Clostridia bacterium]|nr:DUF2800 domain-containing protein [Clostridia bacterium]
MNSLNNHNSRAHALLSASSAHRWLACPPSAVAAEAYPAQDTEFTREGTLAHEVAERIARCSLDGIKYDWNICEDWSSDDVTREMVDCAIGYADYILEQLKDEGPVVLLEQRVDFSPWVPQGFGTCDCIILQGDSMTVIDYKYGVGVPVSAEDNPQMKLYALGALNDFGIAFDVARVEMHIYQPRINNISAYTLTVDELMDWAERVVKPTAAKAIKGKGDYSAGAHCKFCPHAGRCRELTKTCTEYVEIHSLRAAVPVLAPHEVAEVLAMEPLISLWLKRVKAQALDTLLDGGEVPGWKVVEGRSSREWKNEMLVIDTLVVDGGYSKEQITKTELLSPAAMEKALGKKKVAELLDGLIDRSPGAPTVVPATDKRPAYNRADDFEKLD